jgi:hypothetical protein
MKTMKRTARILGQGAGAAALLGVGYIGMTWARYGKASHAPSHDPLLDRFMPSYEVREVHETIVAAAAPITYATARELDLRRSSLVRAIFAGRELLMGTERRETTPATGFLAEVLALGWRILAEEPGRQVVLGAVTQPWKADVVFRGLPPEEFAEFNEPGYAKIVWNLAAEELGAGVSVFRTETRVVTTDSESRSRFRIYWSLVSPGILLIRREALRLVRSEAERRSHSS